MEPEAAEGGPEDTEDNFATETQRSRSRIRRVGFRVFPNLGAL